MTVVFRDVIAFGAVRGADGGRCKEPRFWWLCGMHWYVARSYVVVHLHDDEVKAEAE